MSLFTKRSGERSGRTRKAARVLAAAAMAAGCVALASPAQAVSSWSGGAPCRGSSPVYFGNTSVTLNPCAYDDGTNLVHAAVWATGANTDVRVWYQIFNVVNGNQLGAPATNPHNELLPAYAGATEIGLNPWYSTACYGGPFVVKAWITESGNSYGDVESPQFWC